MVEVRAHVRGMGPAVMEARAERDAIVHRWNPDNKSYGEMTPSERIKNDVLAAQYRRVVDRIRKLDEEEEESIIRDMAERF